jgi:predicted transcriptional regulator
MKTIIDVESFEQTRKRKLARARLLDKGVRMEPEKRITFERPEDMLACLTPRRLHLLRAARRKPQSVSELAASVARNRSAVRRDLGVLSQAGLVTLTSRVNPGHGQVQIVRAGAVRFTLTTEI